MNEITTRKTARISTREKISTTFRDALKFCNVRPWGLQTARSGVIIASCLFGAYANAGVIFLADFETGRIADAQDKVDGFGAKSMEIPGTNEKELRVQQGITRNGSYAVECTLHIQNHYGAINGGDKDKPRCNLSKWSERFDYDKDYWFGFSVFLPADWIDDNNSNRDELMQIHPGNGSGPPIVNLEVEGGNWRSRNAWDPNNVSVVAGVTSRATLFQGATADDKGKWTDWVFHFRFCTQPGCDGRIEVWKNGRQVIDHRGPNALKYSGDGPYISLNLYKYGWKTNPSKVPATRTVYFDEIRIGDSQSSLAEVSPRGGSSSLVSATPPATSTRRDYDGTTLIICQFLSSTGQQMKYDRRDLI